MVKTRRYFTMEERQKIAAMWRNGMDVASIAAALGRRDGCIYKELRRGYDGTIDQDTLRRVYDPVLANNRLRQTLSERGRMNASGKKSGKADDRSA